MVSQPDLFPETLAAQQLIHDNCFNSMKQMAENSIDFIVTDPPYGLNFMAKKWDSEIPNIDIWKECLRICKPCAMIAVFGGSRTHHRLMCAIEDAGFEIRDVIFFLYGSGFPKGLNIGKHLEGFEGYNTNLKPAYEPIILAMKPCDGTFANNAQKWGLAGINIDANRIGIDEIKTHAKIKGSSFQYDFNGCSESFHNGRWPANLILDEQVAQALDQQTTHLKTGHRNRENHKVNVQDDGFIYNKMKPQRNFQDFNDSGGASRFFYCAKASSSERNRGLDDMSIKQTTGGGGTNNTADDVCGKYGSIKAPQRNFHPTVKPISLMKYILKLLAPPGNPICLDPFMGSGTTGIACKELNINFIGIEKELEYFEIAEKRIENS